jgi:hypothetical protein
MIGRYSISTAKAPFGKMKASRALDASFFSQSIHNRQHQIKGYFRLVAVVRPDQPIFRSRGYLVSCKWRMKFE